MWWCVDHVQWKIPLISMFWNRPLERSDVFAAFWTPPGLKINMLVFDLEVRQRKEYHQRRCSEGRGFLWISSMNETFKGALHCVTWSTTDWRNGWSSMWLPKVTNLLKSKSGSLYLALPMVRCGLCLGLLGFRLYCVLLHEGSLYIMKWLLFKWGIVSPPFVLG